MNGRSTHRPPTGDRYWLAGRLNLLSNNLSSCGSRHEAIFTDNSQAMRTSEELVKNSQSKKRSLASFPLNVMHKRWRGSCSPSNCSSIVTKEANLLLMQSVHRLELSKLSFSILQTSYTCQPASPRLPSSAELMLQSSSNRANS